MYGGVHEFHLAVLAYSNARLRGFDLAASDTLPYRHSLGGRILTYHERHSSLRSSRSTQGNSLYAVEHGAAFLQRIEMPRVRFGVGDLTMPPNRPSTTLRISNVIGFEAGQVPEFVLDLTEGRIKNRQPRLVRRPQWEEEWHAK